MVSSTGRPGSGRSPSASATASGTSSGSVTAARSANQAPSGYSSATAAAISTASRVLPAPPGPTTLTSRRPPTRSASSARSAARPTKGVTARGRLCAASVTVRGRGNCRDRPVETSWYSRSRSSKPRSWCRPRSSSHAPSTRSPAWRAVDAEHSTWPPCAAAAIRAARCTSGVAYSPPRGWATPVCRPIRTRGRASGTDQACAASARCASAHAASALRASGNATNSESPSLNKGVPPQEDNARRSSRRCSVSMPRYPGPSIRANRVEPSLAVAPWRRSASASAAPTASTASAGSARSRTCAATTARRSCHLLPKVE